ncbi:MAG: hypothetical protein M5U34_39020 [Chloroflexi bacterium]|nr:hypothetical protein [Chloroflexota bacterium]
MAMASSSKKTNKCCNSTPSADLNAAIDMDLYSEDGSLLLLYGDGRIRYYDTRAGRLQWDEQELMANGGLTLPLANPTAAKLVGKGLNASIFVADPGTGAYCANCSRRAHHRPISGQR